ncbi:MAG: hypothetical protein HQK76_03805 [Desulfobacterales bacterium]|nr:hypothetical protein [Desulfobacterales bacterium]
MRLKKFIIFFLMYFILFFVHGCSDEITPDQRALSSKKSDQSKPDAPKDIYDLLKDYPAMESLFTYGTITKEEFENKLFRELLADKQNANTIVKMLDGLPPLFDARGKVPKGIFTAKIEAEMSQKGAVQDLLSVTAGITRRFLELPTTQKKPFYDYLDKLDALDENNPQYEGAVDYIIDILRDVVDYLSTVDEDSVNYFMDTVINELKGMQSTESASIDFADIDDFVIQVTDGSKGSLQELIVGVKELIYDKRVQKTMKQLFYNLGVFFRNPELKPILKDLFRNLNITYNKDQLGDILERCWTKGIKVGEWNTIINFPGYGQYGRMRYNLKHLLMQPKVLDSVVEMVYIVSKNGYSYDEADEGLAQMIKNDPFALPRDGDGEFGGGVFYEPDTGVDAQGNDIPFSYKNFSGLRAIVKLAARFCPPLAITSSYLYENNAEDGQAFTNLVRLLLPEIDKIPVAAILWAEIYERPEGVDLCNGVMRREKKYGEYGMLIDDGVDSKGNPQKKFIKPLLPAINTGTGVACALLAECILNGPFDNVYDNGDWLFTGRNLYGVLDILQFLPKISPLGFPLGKSIEEAIREMGITTLPIVVVKFKGANDLIFMEVGNLLETLPETISNGVIDANIPRWIIDPLVTLVKEFVPLGYPAEGTNKLYITPQDLRDVWAVLNSVPYYTDEAFDRKRFLDRGNPYNYARFYNTEGYSYPKDKDKANPVAPLASAVLIGLLKPYLEVVKDLPPTLEAVPQQQAAARAAFGGAICPIDFVVNLLAPLSEKEIETSLYVDSDQQMPFVRYIEPLIAMESTGALDKILELLTILGSPEMKQTRWKILNNLAKIVTTSNDASKAPYGLASMLLFETQNENANPRYWDVLDISVDTLGEVLSPNFMVVENVINIMDYLTAVSMTDSEWMSAAEGIETIITDISGEKTITRALIDVSDTLTHLNATHTWSDSLKLINNTLEPGGLVDYLIAGMEADPKYTWDEFLYDVTKFMTSDEMVEYGEGSFWRDIYYMTKFMADAFK